jgi:hypothetical protein
MMKRPFGIWLLSTGLLLLFIGGQATVSATAETALIGPAPTSVSYILALIGAAAAIWGLGLLSTTPESTQ